MKKSRKKTSSRKVHPVEIHSLFTDYDIHLFRSGKHYQLYEKFGSHLAELNGVKGTYFSVWAPNAEYVAVLGDFNGWNHELHPLYVRWDESGIWEGWIPYVGERDNYRYFIRAKGRGFEQQKIDPFGFYHNQPPQPSTRIHDTWYEWHDQQWMKIRKDKNKLEAPISVYEMHIGSWRRSPSDPDKVLGYRDIAGELVPYLKYMGFTHVEFLPVMEHPFYGSWGYQVTGYYAACSRYGFPQDLMHLIDQLHQNDIGVFLDWVPSHFPGDAHGLIHFDGTALYEHADPRKGFHPDWNSYIFNYGRTEVRSFLISNALFWLDRYHVDGLRVDAVASMLYLDYSRKAGEWIPNESGGRENLEAISFLKEFNEQVYHSYPDVATIAEESTAYPKVTRPTYNDGLGFGMKWMMGWMNDTLKYFEFDPIYRQYHHHLLTFSIMYAFSENFMLPFSHDEVVHLKKSMRNKMPGDEWQQFANLRCLYAYMYAHPGAKLLFMGAEFGQSHEWAHERSLDWHQAGHAPNKGLENWLHDLNHVYKTEAALYQKNFSADGFEWAQVNDAAQSVIAFFRKGNKPTEIILFAVNLTPVNRPLYRFGVPLKGRWKEILNSDDLRYHGTGNHLNGEKRAEKIHESGKDQSIVIDLPPLGAVMMKWVKPGKRRMLPSDL
jgi:1,4-alpha-glucan branching enzyme